MISTIETSNQVLIPTLKWYQTNDNNTEFGHQFKNIYIFFFILCNLKNSYGYFILNVHKIDPKLANSFFKNTHHYFL